MFITELAEFKPHAFLIICRCVCGYVPLNQPLKACDLRSTSY